MMSSLPGPSFSASPSSGPSITGDGERHLSRRLAQALGIDARPSALPGDDPPFAWDIYLAYRRGNPDIERPDFWMHQLAIDHAPRFEAAEWRRRIEAMIDNAA